MASWGRVENGCPNFRFDFLKQQQETDVWCMSVGCRCLATTCVFGMSGHRRHSVCVKRVSISSRMRTVAKGKKPVGFRIKSQRTLKFRPDTFLGFKKRTCPGKGGRFYKV